MDFTGQEPLGKCPKCGARVFERGMNYVCEKAVGANRTCDFRTGKIILQQADRAASQMTKLLATGKTDLLEKFISKKAGTFKAFLVVKDGETWSSSSSRAKRRRKAAAKAGQTEEPRAEA